MSKGLEALNNLVQSCFNSCDSDEVLSDKTIVEKSLKALEIIKEKCVDVFRINYYITSNRINELEEYKRDRNLTEEELELLKEVLE